MPNRRQSEILRTLSIAALALGLFGADCSNLPPSKASLPCDAQVAQIAIWDGRIQKVCGCGGTDGEFAAPGATLSCTFALGKTLFFTYQGPFLRHQVVADGTPALPSSAVFDPSASVPVRAHAFTATAAGTYLFRDEFDQTITGSIVITP